MASNAVQGSRGERGAALIIAVGVLTVLLVIGATFFRISRTELQVATNVTDQVRMDLMADGATAVAIAHLKQDRVNNPTATSLDHPWNTYFNGAWAAGKPWMWQGTGSLAVRDGVDNDGDGETDEEDEFFTVDLSADGEDNDGDGAANPDELFEGSDFVAGVIPVVRLLPDGDLPANPTDIPDPPDYRFPREANGDPHAAFNDGNPYDDPNPVEIRPLPTNLSTQLYIPRVEDAGGPPQLPAIDITTQPAAYTLTDLGDLYDGTDDSEFDAAAAAAAFPWVVARNRAGGDFGVSPIYDADGDPTNNDSAPRLTEEQIHLWADVDNDGDGLNDSVWLPVSAIRVLDNDNLDNDLDGVVDEPGELGIFIYNAANDGLDNDGDGVVDNEHDDGVDNDGDGDVDEVDEPRIMFTTHFRAFLNREGEDDNGNNGALTADGIDNDGDGLIDETNEGVDEPFEGALTAINLLQDEWERAIPFINFDVAPLPNPETDVDVLDNDYTLIVNDRSDMARYVNAELYDTLDQLDGADDDELHVDLEIFAEPVSEITGRMAVKVTDVSTKVNVNAAGGFIYTRDRSDFPAATDFDDVAPPLGRSFGDGLRITEYETRVLPDIGDGNARYLWQRRMGAPQGDFVWDPLDGWVPEYAVNWNGQDPNYYADVSNPGYGLVDDSGDALWLSMNGLDDSGSGTIDDGLRLNDYGAGDVFAEFLEGIDHPGEWQRFQPLRNTLAEEDNQPNTSLGDPDPLDGVIDAATLSDFIGELGDTYFKTHESTKTVVSIIDDFTNPGNPINEGINAERFGRIEPFITVHSTDRNIRFEHALDQNILNEPQDRSVSGVRLDINLADAARIREALLSDFGYESVDPEVVNEGASDATDDDDTVSVFAATETVNFALGLKRGDVTVEAVGEDGRLLGVTLPVPGVNNDKRLRLRHDPRLRAAQLAVNTQDFRDVDRVRARLTTFFQDEWWAGEGGVARAIEYRSAGVEAVRINELMVRPVRRIEAEMEVGNPDRDPNAFSDALFGVGVDDDFFDVYNPAPADGVVIGRQMADIVEDNATNPPAYNPEDIWQVHNDNLMGLHSVWAATEPEIQNPDFIPDTGVPQTFPNVIQFTFEASPQLPPGRYYLTINTVAPEEAGAGAPDGDPSNDTLYETAGDQTTLRATATESNPVLFATKYIAETEYDVTNRLELVSGMTVTAGLTDIVEDVYQATLDDTSFHRDQIWRSMILGYRDPGVTTSGLSGWAFLPTSAERVDNPSDLTTEVPPASVYGYFQDSGYTVEIPDPDLADNAGDRPRLCVAFKHDFDPDDPSAPVPSVIAINFFDFSQEPDHEYIELVNIDRERPVDIGGWAVTVDGEVTPGTNDRRKVMTVPQNTTIAPGGSVLLVANKFDQFVNDPDEPNLLESNGIGMVNPPGGNFENVTVPPIGGAENVFTGTAGGQDFVDNDGDGAEDSGAPNRPDDEIDSDNADADEDVETGTNNIGDRIIELEIPEFDNVTDVQRLAQVVLGGGMLPNYPERDGIDNDLDNRVGVANPLQNDLVDNDGDGQVDEANEGVDEGFRLHYRGHSGIDTDQMPGGFGAPQVYRIDIDDNGTPEVRDPNGVDDPVNAGDDYEYMGHVDESPAFRAFQERRWYPGDNVIVTLYEDGGTGTGTEGGLSRVVDRVTYNELDVINRSIDDLISVILDPQLQLDTDYDTFWPHDTMGIDFYKALERKHPLYNGDRFGTSNRWQAADGAYDDWADRTSRLERVVDFEFDEITVQSRVGNALFDHAYTGSPLRMNLPHRLAENPFSDGTLAPQFDDNDISDDGPGTEQTPRQWAFNRVDVVGDRSRPMLRAPSQLMKAPHMVRKSYLQSRPQAVATGTPGLTDIDSVNVLYEQDGVLPVDSSVRQDRSIQQVLMGQTFPAPDAGRVSPVQTGGPNDPEVEALRADLHALTSIFAAHTSQSLTAGQARVFPMWPFPLDTDLVGGGAAAQVNNVPTGYQWALPGPVGITPPSGWSPVHLWSLASDDDANSETRHNMFAPPFAGDPDILFARRYLMEDPPSIGVDTERWPLDLRATMYVSGNLPAGPANTFGQFNSATEHVDASGSEALFVWTGEDGLENGEYDVYVMLNEPVGQLNAAHLESVDQFATDLLTNDATTDGETNFGRRFMETALSDQQSETSRESVLPEDVEVDIDFFTDRNGDRKVWNMPDPNDTTNTPGLPKPGSLNDGFDDDPLGFTPFVPHPTLIENFGLQTGASPGADGIYHYPLPVKVENNYLAMFLRNRTASGSMIRFSRIILAPRDRTPGKLNINTMTTRGSEQPGPPPDPGYVNVLSGIPGLNRDFNLVSDTLLAAANASTAALETDYPGAGVVSTGTDPENLLGRASKLALGRTDHVDGRYYDLLIDSALPLPGQNAFAEVEIQEPGVAGDDEEPVFSSETDSTLFEQQFDEVYERYTRTENLVTTRSDVFEILVTVQTGSVADRNGDGVLNYRDDFEFTVTGERQMRTVYER